MTVNYKDDDYCIFDPSEIRELALQATNSYFANIPLDIKNSLMSDPVKYTTMFVKIYADTINEIEHNYIFKNTRSRR